MKIGDDTNFLEIIPAPAAGTPGIFQVNAQFSDSLSECCFKNEAVVFDTSPAVREALEQFATLKKQSFAVAVGGAGSIGLRRESRGAISVNYRIPSFERDGFVEGELRVDGEYANGLIADLRKAIVLV